MSKHLKLFKTEDDFTNCLDAKIAGNNDDMGFPNVSVIGEEDNNGNFSASDIFYIKDLNKAKTIRQIFSHWINPTIVNITNDNSYHTIKSINVTINSGPSFEAYRFQPYDWYDKKTNSIYYAFISYDAFTNITDGHLGKGDVNINLLSIDAAHALIYGVDGYDPQQYFFSDWSQYDDHPKYSGHILYVKDLSKVNKDEIYLRAFSIKDGTLVFEDIKPFPYKGSDLYAYFTTNSFDESIEGYPDAESGSGSGDGN